MGTSKKGQPPARPVRFFSVFRPKTQCGHDVRKSGHDVTLNSDSKTPMTEKSEHVILEENSTELLSILPVKCELFLYAMGIAFVKGMI